MAIAEMKHLTLISFPEFKDKLISEMSDLGCLEIIRKEDGEEPRVVSKKIADASAKLSETIKIIEKITQTKRGLFSSKPTVTQSLLLDRDFLKTNIKRAQTILSFSKRISELEEEISANALLIEKLLPWQTLDMPLESPSSSFISLFFGNLPSSVDFYKLSAEVENTLHDAQLFHVLTDKNRHYFFSVSLFPREDDLREYLSDFGFIEITFPHITGSANENLCNLYALQKKLNESLHDLNGKISAYRSSIDDFYKAKDALSILLRRFAAENEFSDTQTTVILTAWFPSRKLPAVEKFLKRNTCAYQIRAPRENEIPPVLVYNTRPISPFSLITDMYSPPSYHGIDPNPFMAPFFSIFFGIMLSDAGYGLILIVAGIFGLFKFKTESTLRKVLIITLFCGISTLFFGLLFGSFFGDSIASVYTLITKKPFNFETALWFNPLKDPIKMLVFSFALGGIHIACGMAIQAYLLIREGRIADAIFDIGFWWLVLGGAVFLILGQLPLGISLSVIGVSGLILTQGRHEKKLIKKITKGIGSLYGITSYLGDILSYSRLLALSLATGVIASVMNTMGTLTGPFGFVIIFLIGHTFNIAINLIGSYVHTARLQYVEFFGKFYKGGGKIFSPLDNSTIHTTIVKEKK